jgi:hypothetical protein
MPSRDGIKRLRSMATPRTVFIESELEKTMHLCNGTYIYGPDRPGKIIYTSITYTCECGYETKSPGDIYDHCTQKAKKLYTRQIDVNQSAGRVSAGEGNRYEDRQND